MNTSKLITFSVDPSLDNLITRYGRSAYRFFSSMDYADLKTLGVKVIEGEHPRSTYYEAELAIPIEEANARAEASGIDIRFKLKEMKLPAKTMKGILSERVAGPEERLFGGKGIIIPFRFSVPNQNEQADRCGSTAGMPPIGVSARSSRRYAGPCSGSSCTLIRTCSTRLTGISGSITEANAGHSSNLPYLPA